MKKWTKYVMALATSALVCAGFSTLAVASDSAGDVTRATLDNGLRVVIVKDELAPVVTTEMNYLVGSNEAPTAFPGRAHALEHMMFRGSPGLSRDQLLAIAANMGGRFNATTQEGVTQYYFTVPSQDLGVALHVAATRMRGANVTQKDWEQERGAIEQEVSRDMSNPGYKFYSQLRGHLFAGTPYAHTPLGTRPSFDKTSAADLKAFYKAWYVPNNAILVIAGDVDPQATLAKVKKLFDDIPRGDLPQRPAFDFKPITAKTFKLPTDYSVGIVAMAWRMPGMLDKDYATALVLSRALDSKRGKLFAMGLTGKALSGSFSGNFLQHAGIGFAEAAFPRGGDAQKVLTTLRGIMKDTAENGVPADLVKAAKQRAIADLEYRKNSVAGLANAWSSALALRQVESPDAIRSAIEAVTPAEVDALARRLFGTGQAVTAILTPQSSGKPVSHSSYGGAESFGGKPAANVTLPDWAASAFAKLPQYETTQKPASFTLDNGMRIIVQPESVSKTVKVYGQIKTNPDMQVPKGQKGVASVLGGLFEYGTTDMDRLAYQTALDEISADVSAGTSFSLAVPSAHFARGMQLLADKQLHPALPAKAFAIVQKNRAGAVAGRNKSPDFLNGLHMGKALLPKDDPSLRHATPESVNSLTLADVKAYYAKVFRPDMTTMVVIGDVTPEQVRKVAEADFGAWQAKGPKPDVDYPKVPLNKPSRFNTPDSSAVQASVTMSQIIEMGEHSPDRYALVLGNQILGGGSLNTMLMRDLRVNGGLVYGVWSYPSLDKNRGTFTVGFGSDPGKVDKARAMVISDVKKMQTTPVDAKALHSAKGQILRRLQLVQASFDSIGSDLLSLALQGKPLNANAIAAGKYRALTAQDIREVFETYVRPDGFVTAVKGPAGK